ncbi:AI-2E family transporter [Bacillus sp. FJAT-50079]|uniref:AI-2E family transporter n=1 Tax=Bacillus sp. FJAT-50079 TaxID=2833577 RepID=UPI001BC96769|nr:AI-2E family transporter [Bacillus sp. FJAT-50079]MBS4209011.1 AI-2E family transporter [Bacillus sp. FJAT-50079]
MQQQRFRIFYRIGIILLILITLYCLLLLKPLWKPILHIMFVAAIPFFISAFIAFLLHPLVEKIQLLGLSRGWAIMTIYTLFFGGAGYGIYLGIPFLIEQLNDFSQRLPILVEQYKEWIQGIQASASRWPDGIQVQIDERITKFELWMNKFLEKSMESLIGLVNFMFVLLIIPFISFYLLKDIELVKKAAWYMTPKKWRAKAGEFIGAVYLSLGSYVRGQFLICVIVGVASSIAFLIIRIDYPIILGFIIAVTNVIPYFGAFIGLIPVLAIALLSSVKQAIFATIIVFILQFIEGNILSPYIVGKSLAMHPLFIFAGLIIGGEVAGVLGMIIAVPIIAVIKIAIVHMRDHMISTKSS